MDHTNEQQKMLELKRQEIAEQVTALGPAGDGGVLGDLFPLLTLSVSPCAAETPGAGDAAGDAAAGRGDHGAAGNLHLPAAGGGDQNQEAEEGKIVVVRDNHPSSHQSPEAHCRPQAVGLMICSSRQLYAKLQAVKAEIQDQHDEYIRVRQDLEEAQNEQTRELKLK